MSRIKKSTKLLEQERINYLREKARAQRVQKYNDCKAEITGKNAYQLQDAYDKYGIDIVNSVREELGF